MNLLPYSQQGSCVEFTLKMAESSVYEGKRFCAVKSLYNMHAGSAIVNVEVISFAILLDPAFFFFSISLIKFSREKLVSLPCNCSTLN